MHLVAVLALDGVIPFELSIPSRIFATATSDDGTPLYETVTCTIDGGPVHTQADYAITVSRDATVLADADTVVIPSSPVGVTGELPVDVADALATIRPARGWCRSASARSRSRRRVSSTTARPRRTGCTPSTSNGGFHAFG